MLRGCPLWAGGTVRRWLMSSCTALVAFGCMEGEPEVETNFEISRFQGRWFEIARIPRDHDADCHDTVADYRITSSEQMELTHTCFAGSPSGTKRQFRAVATVDDPSVPAKLSLQIGLYAGAYWVLDVGDAYDYAVIGHPSRTMLWILSRAPELDAATWNQALAVAQKQGFSTGLLQRTPQSS
jgi:apolipoprotein D and lipocalin family protein